MFYESEEFKSSTWLPHWRGALYRFDTKIDTQVAKQAECWHPDAINDWFSIQTKRDFYTVNYTEKERDSGACCPLFDNLLPKASESGCWSVKIWLKSIKNDRKIIQNDKLWLKSDRFLLIDKKNLNMKRNFCDKITFQTRYETIEKPEKRHNRSLSAAHCRQTCRKAYFSTHSHITKATQSFTSSVPHIRYQFFSFIFFLSS